MGEVRGKTFVVESALMYGAEVWGSCKWLDCMEQVKLRAYRIFLGVAGYIPRHLYKLGDVRLVSVKGMSNAEVQYMLKNCALEGSDHDVGGQVVSFFLVAKVGFQLVSVLLIISLTVRQS